MSVAINRDLESERLKSLYSYEVLDSNFESAYDDIAELASEVCGVPTALISLVDKDRVWFKAQTGVGLRQAPRSTSFCDYAIQSSGIFEVSDLSKDSRFMDHLSVVGGARLKFYAGVALLDKEGFPLGSLCVLGRVPKQLTGFQKKTLERLGKQVSAQLELRKKNIELKGRISELEIAHKEIEKQQEKLINSSKMVSLGEMAGGIAHEINNPLAIIKGVANLASLKNKKGMVDKEGLLKDLEKIDRTANRIVKIVKSLKNFCFKGKLQKKSNIEIKTLLDQTLELCFEKFKTGGVDLKIDFSNCEENQEVFCCPVDISHVLLNLLNNACDAIEDFEDKWIKIKVIKEQFKIKVFITDCGVGISPKVSGKLMTAFFTTKSEGKGTGLGLSIARNLAKSNDGDLEYLPDKENTTFCLTLNKFTGQEG